MMLLVDLAARVTFVLGVALVMSALLRTRSAAWRHWLLATAIACAAAMPALGRIAPSWNMVVAPAAIVSVASAPPATSIIAVPSALANDTPPVVMSGERRRAIDLVTVLGWIWAAGFITCAGLLGTGLARLWWLAAHARSVTDGRWFDLAHETAREAGVARRIRLLHGAHPALLVTWGLLRPTILLPATALHWSDDRIRIVLRHEIAHIRRHDWSVQLVAEFVHAVHWFNPLAWIARHRLRDASEQACDDEVIASGVDPAAYATHLLQLARLFTSGRGPWAAVPAMAQPCSLERRITAMLSPCVNRTPASRAARLATALPVLAFTVAIAGAAIAQSATARFSGMVSDPTGAPLPDTTITLTHRETTVGHALPTDQAGAFDFAALPPGEYALEARTPGFATLKETITLRAGDAVQRDFRLNIGTVEESITVSGVARPSMPRNAPASVESIVAKFAGKRLQPPIKIKDVRPEYPQSLRDAGVEGRVVLEGRIAADGSVTDIRVVDAAHQDLVKPARDAASQWQFEPTRLWGTPVDVLMTMTFNFQRQPAAK